MDKVKLMLVDKVVNYWAGFLDGSKKVNFNNGVTGPAGGMLSEFFENGKPPKCTQVEIDSFKTILRHKIIRNLEDSEQIVLDVDYSPCLELHSSLSTAGLSTANRFPVKTDMYIDTKRNRVEVSEGHGAEGVLI